VSIVSTWKFNKIVIVDNLVAILPKMHEIFQEAHTAFVVEFREHGRQRRDARDIRQVTVIVLLLRTHHVKVSFLQASLGASRYFLRFGAQHIRLGGKLPLAVPMS